MPLRRSPYHHLSHGSLGNGDLSGDAVVDAPFVVQGGRIRLNVIRVSVGVGVRLR
jgi:hypothetical protein